ncbi:hypothetical protein KR044_011915 [Drosophila immigrans]|nr:hypothetical protein KR044_011915 [Drosophila immigrans]
MAFEVKCSTLNPAAKVFQPRPGSIYNVPAEEEMWSNRRQEMYAMQGDLADEQLQQPQQQQYYWGPYDQASEMNGVYLQLYPTTEFANTVGQQQSMDEVLYSPEQQQHLQQPEVFYPQQPVTGQQYPKPYQPLVYQQEAMPLMTYQQLPSVYQRAQQQQLLPSSSSASSTSPTPTPTPMILPQQFQPATTQFLMPQQLPQVYQEVAQQLPQLMPMPQPMPQPQPLPQQLPQSLPQPLPHQLPQSLPQQQLPQHFQQTLPASYNQRIYQSVPLPYVAAPATATNAQFQPPSSVAARPSGRCNTKRRQQLPSPQDYMFQGSSQAPQVLPQPQYVLQQPPSVGSQACNTVTPLQDISYLHWNEVILSTLLCILLDEGQPTCYAHLLSQLALRLCCHEDLIKRLVPNAMYEASTKGYVRRVDGKFILAEALLTDYQKMQ